MNQYNLTKWLSTICPTFWSFLNNKAQKELPKGISEYVGGGSKVEIEYGRTNILTIEKYLSELVSYCGEEQVGDNYRRDLSGVNSEQTLSELFCEIALCAKVASYSKKIDFRPETGKGTQSDCRFFINGFEIYGEAKRYQDTWPYISTDKKNDDQRIPFSRSIFKSPPHEKPIDAARPRYMDIQSKLVDVHRQFPDDTINILFIFHPALGQTRDYLVQALLGETNFGRKESEFTLEADGLFAKKGGEIISACCIARAILNDKVVFPLIIENPLKPVEKEIVEKLKSA